MRAAIVLLACCSVPMLGATSSYTGTLTSPEDSASGAFVVNVPFAGVLTVQTWGFGGGTNAEGTAIAAGGFDPFVAVFSGTGATAAFLAGSSDILSNYSSHAGCPAAGKVMIGANSDCGDVAFSVTVAPGSYTIVLTDAGYVPAAVFESSGTLGDGFIDLTGGAPLQTCDGACIAPTGNFALDIGTPGTSLGGGSGGGGVTITGQVTLGAGGLSGASVALTGSATASTSTNAGGAYGFTGLAPGGAFTLTPSLAGYVFQPPSSTVTNVTSNQTLNFTATVVAGTLTAAATPAGSSTPANLNAAPTTLAAPVTFHAPIDLDLNTGESVSSLSFTVQVTPNGGAPALTGALSFTDSSTVAPAPAVSANGANAATVAWSSLNAALSGAQSIGVLNGTIPAGAQVGQSYAIAITAASAAGGGSSPPPVTLNLGANGTLSVALTYLEGDTGPNNSDAAPNFGDGVLNIQDLIQELFAVNNIPGFRPAACSDRFDAMDLYPADASPFRGGDGALDIRDLVLELFRVNNLDLNRPVRASRGGACAAAAGAGAAETSRLEAAPKPPPPADGALLLGAPEPAGAGAAQIPVYLAAYRNLNNLALTFGAGDLQSPLRFIPVSAAQPALVHDSQTGVAAAVWQSGISITAGERLLLGYLSGASDAAPGIRIFGASASSGDGRAIRLDLPLDLRR
ncbi:MAG TPA: DVUA0089 family protein [Bryobacteraceae bacterium]|nr:DVUA0089 family protein [Bryobacteraceae bacterium]